MLSKVILSFTANLNALRDFVRLLQEVIDMRASAALTKHGDDVRRTAQALYRIDPTTFSGLGTLEETQLSDSDIKFMQQVKLTVTPSPDNSFKRFSIEVPTGSIDPRELVGAIAELDRHPART